MIYFSSSITLFSPYLFTRSVGIDCQYFDSKFNKFRSIKTNREVDPDKEIVVVLANLAGASVCVYMLHIFLSLQHFFLSVFWFLTLTDSVADNANVHNFLQST